MKSNASDATSATVPQDQVGEKSSLLKKVPLKIRKRDGRIADFDQEKITAAIYKAAESVGGKDRSLAEKLSRRVVEELSKNFNEKHIPSVEEVQDIVEKVLIENGHAKTAKSYILYRQKRKDIREARSLLLDAEFDKKLS
nr:ATP cone domain-containing protein [Candidatus Njordarchaeum guaymaensis]